jgi:hypothetical protein
VIVGHRNEVILGQHLALRQDLNGGVIDGEVPTDRPAACGFGHRIERERADIIFALRGEARGVGVCRLDISEGNASARVLGWRGRVRSDRDLVELHCGSIVAVGELQYGIEVHRVTYDLGAVPSRDE